ncbi:MAG: SAM-dependent methyltransferase [Gammaproteobacteria bacterium]|nr:MAG: SAM-dependent methyltransferase [Gammaproteobacteria bacterium]
MKKNDKKNLGKTFWQSRYEQGKIGWDMGCTSPPIKAFIDSELANASRDLSILIAGAGNAHEAQYLHQQGFNNVTVVDLVRAPLDNFADNVPTFNKKHLLESDFFALDEQTHQFDLSIEQTFFCAIDPERRAEFVQKTYTLLKPRGRLIGLLWDCDFASDEPPFGGSKAEYEALFSEQFELVRLVPCANSHPKRQGRELFVEFVKK